MDSKFDVVGRIKKVARCTCYLLVGIGCQAVAEDRFSGFDDTSHLMSSSTLYAVKASHGHEHDKVMSVTQALWAVMFENGVSAFNGGGLTDPGTRAGFVIQRDNTDLSFKYRF